MLNEAIKAANHTVPKTEESANEAANVASELSFFVCICTYMHLYLSLGQFSHLGSTLISTKINK